MFRKLTCIAIVFSLALPVIGQDAPAAAGATGEIRELHQSFLDSANAFRKSDIEKSIDYVTQSLSLLDSRGNIEERARSYTALGELFQYHRQYDLAIENFRLAQETKPSVRTGLLMGNTLLSTKDFKAAEQLFRQYKNYQLPTPYQEIQAREGLGDALLGQDRVNEALREYQEALRIAETNGIKPKVSDLNSKIAAAFDRGNRFEEAEAYYGNTLELSNELPPRSAVREKEKVADFYNKRQKFDDEIALRKKSLQDLEAVSPVADQADGPIAADTVTAQRINYKIASAYIAQDKMSEAIPYLEESIKGADEANDLTVQKDATRQLSEVYSKQGNFTKALETYRRYVAVVDTLYLRKEAEIEQAARLNREIASKQNRITGLEQQRELSESKYNLALTEQKLVEESIKRQRWIIYSLALVLLLTALAAFFFYRSNQQQKLANNLLALRSLRSQMNPHFIFNALNSVNSFIARNDEKSANKYLSDFAALMRAVMENSEADFISLAEEISLLEKYLKLEHARFPEQFTYELKVDPKVDASNYQIPPMLLQPYVENAVWHGLRYKETPGYVKVEVKKESENLLKIVVEDNGIGRKRSAELKTKHQGLQESRGMRNISRRIEILNSMYDDKVEVTIDDLNPDGTGTRVTMLIHRAK